MEAAARPVQFLRGYPWARMRCQTACFSSSLMNTQLATSMAVRPQPRQMSSNRVEHTATQGESGLETGREPAAPGDAAAGAAPASGADDGEAAASGANSRGTGRDIRER